MTKSEFILCLSEALAHLPGQERVRVLEYYEEMIDDRIENGMSESDAVAAMGSIEEILKEAAPEALHVHHIEPKTVPSEDSANILLFRDPVDTLIANSVSAELHVLTADLPDGVTARVDYVLSENEQCECSLTGGKLEVRYKAVKQRGFSFGSLFSRSNASITITLRNPALVRGDIGASSGSIDLNGLVFTDRLEVKTASGNVDAHDVAVQHSCKLHTASGDVSATNLTCGDLLEVHTASGDMDLYDIRAGKIDVGTASGEPTLGSIECDKLNVSSASGDLDLHHIRAGKISAGSASGDITLGDSDCSGTIEMNSSSGDIDIREIRSNGNIQLSSVSGDINGNLNPADNYTFCARSRIGDVHVPQTNGSCRVEIQTKTGDIRF